MKHTQDDIRNYYNGFEAAKSDIGKFNKAYAEDLFEKILYSGGWNKFWIEGYNDYLNDTQCKYAYPQISKMKTLG